MPLQLLEGVFEEIHEYISIMFAAYSDPLHVFVSTLLPGLGSDDPELVKQGIAGEAERALARWKANPSERWMKVVVSETGEIIGVSRWQIYDENPFPNGPPKMDIVWLPEGSALREYYSYIMTTRIERQANRCTSPYIWLNMMGTLPTHRHRGAASLMLQWGVKKADELDYNLYVEAADSTGGHVYRKAGFVQVDKYWTRKEQSETSDEWKKLEETYPFEAAWMERPKKGVTMESSA